MSPLAFVLTLSCYRRWPSRFTTPYSHNLLVLFSSTAATITPPNGNESPSSGPAPPPIRVALTESTGRAVFATRRIGAGDTIHTAKPIVSHPSLAAITTVCYFCLKKINAVTASQSQGVSFCCENCKESSKVKWVCSSCCWSYLGFWYSNQLVDDWVWASLLSWGAYQMFDYLASRIKANQKLET